MPPRKKTASEQVGTSEHADKKLDLTPVELRAAHNLKRLRADKRYSVRSLSEATAQLVGADKIGPNAISQIETEKRRMSLVDSWTLARALGVSPLEFYLPISDEDGAELGTPGDGYGSQVLPKRIVRTLYRLPHESAPEYLRDAALAAMKNHVGDVQAYAAIEGWRDEKLQEISLKLDKLLGKHNGDD